MSQKYMEAVEYVALNARPGIDLGAEDFEKMEAIRMIADMFGKNLAEVAKQATLMRRNAGL